MWASIDQAVDTFGVIGEVCSQGGNRKLIGIGSDQFGIVINDLLCICVGHAFLAVMPQAGALLDWASYNAEGGEGEQCRAAE